MESGPVTSSEKWEAVIGLEIHAQLKTKTKLFSPDRAEFSSGENDQIHPISLGFPGVLPVLNREALVLALKAGRAFECDIQNQSLFARKSYFYPDLPKGYQISQYNRPFCQGGCVRYHWKGTAQTVRLQRIHIEEDAGRSLHRENATWVNFNRAGTALLEIVTEPDLRDSASASACARAIRRLLRWLEICDGNLEEGSLRCDCNISLRGKSSREFGTRVELKNINSFRFIEKALDYEIKRQTALLEKGRAVLPETRLYDSETNQTAPMRSKETAGDYRYFPDPDLLPVEISKLPDKPESLPELPFQKFERFKKDFGLKDNQIEILMEDKTLCEYFESLTKEAEDPQIVCHWVTGELQARLKEADRTVKDLPFPAKDFARLTTLISRGDISGKMAKEVFAVMWETGKSPEEIIREKGLKQISDEKVLKEVTEKVLRDFPKQALDYKNGRTKLFGFFVGQAMKETKGQAHPQRLSELMKSALEE